MRVHHLEKGAEMLAVVPGSSADEASLRAGDRILAVKVKLSERSAPEKPGAPWEG